MKRLTNAAGFLAFIAILSILLLAGCQPDKVSIEDRIASFMEDINTQDRTNVYKNFDKNNTAEYESIKIPQFWIDNSFPLPDATGSYSITNLDVSNPLNVTGTISGPAGFGPPASIKFIMRDDDDDWYIEELYLGLTQIVYSMW